MTVTASSGLDTYIDSRIDESIEFLVSAVRSPTISGDEYLIEPMLTRWLDAHGWSYLRQPLATDAQPLEHETNVERRANLLAWPWPRRAGRRLLVINGHLDVVPPGDEDESQIPPFAGIRRDGWVHGRGTVDTKGPLVAAMYAVAAVRSLGVAAVSFDVCFQFVCGEETTGIGTRRAFDEVSAPDAAIVLEPTNSRIAPISTGLVFFEIAVRGLAAHTSAPWRGRDAFQHLMRIYAALSATAAERGARYRKRYPDYYGEIPTPVPFVIGTATAGTWRAAVPDTARMAGRWGVAPGEDPGLVKKEIELIIADIDRAAQWPDRTDIVWQHELVGWETDRDHPLVQSLLAESPAGARLLGLTAGSDAALFGARNIPTVVFGPGDLALAHGPAEAVAEQSVVDASRLLARALLEYGRSGDE